MPPLATEADTGSPTPVGVNHLVKYGLLTVLVAVVANALVRLTAISFIAVPVGFWPLGWGAVIVSTVLTAVGATIVYGAISHFSTRPNQIFTVIAAVVLVLSFGSFVAPAPPLVDAPLSVRPPLAVMHVVVAVVSVAILTRATGTVVTPEISHKRR